MFLPADEKLRHRNSSVTLTDDGFGCSYFFAQVLRDEINHVQVRNVSYMLTRVIQPGIRSRIIQDRQIPGCILQGLIYNGWTT